MPATIENSTTVRHAGRVYQIIERKELAAIEAERPNTAREWKRQGVVAELTLQTGRGKWGMGKLYANGSVQVVDLKF